MSSKKHRKKLKQFHQNRKIVSKVIMTSQTVAHGFKILGDAAKMATRFVNNYKTNYHEHSSNHKGNPGTLQC